MVLSTTNTKKIHVRPEISLEDKVYPKTYKHHSQVDIEVDETTSKNTGIESLDSKLDFD